MGKDRVGRCCPERDRPPGRAAGELSLPSVEVPTRPNAPGIGAARARMATPRPVFLTPGGLWGPQSRVPVYSRDRLVPPRPADTLPSGLDPSGSSVLDRGSRAQVTARRPVTR